jgi:predicted transcriptional regulator
MPETADGGAIIRAMLRATWQLAAVRALVSVGAPDQLAGGPLTVAELASRCDADELTLARVLRSLAAAGLVRTASPGSYELTDAGRVLLGGTELHEIRYNMDPELDPALSEITETIRTGQAPFLQRHGSLYSYLEGRPESSAEFDALMATRHDALAARLPAAADLSGVQSVMDVGGGTGTFLAALLRAHPDLKGTLLDLGRVRPAALEYLAAQGVADQAEFIGGDFFAAIPSGADVYLLAHVVHNWDDARAVTILRNVRAAMAADARLMLVEAILPDDDSPSFGKDLDIRLLTLHWGRERSHAEYAKLLTEAGFGPGTATHLAFGTYILTATVADA